MSRPKFGVELILAKEPYFLVRDIAWDCLSFFTFYEGGLTKT
jgi:hypothetical protein